VDVPFRLTRRTAPAAADALLVRGDGFGPVVAAVVRLGSAPAVFPVRGGFVLVPCEPDPPPIPGAVRLRRLAGDLYVPADADLVPSLLPDEAAALTRDRGLVFLPGGPVLAFNPTAPLPAGSWVAPPAVRRAEWEPLPTPPPRAERLTRVEGPAQPVAADVLGAGGPDDADPLPGRGAAGAAGGVPEDARPPAGSPVAGVAAAAAMGAGQLLAWLGRMSRLPGLARLGGKLAQAAAGRVPRLTEKLFGAQEAALREVLRQLQAGDVEKALRRAPPAVSDPDQPARVGTDANLGTRDPRYDLRSLIGPGGGAGVAWLGGGDVWDRLANEYRRLAREATDRGDFRRAAYLYGVLLRDVWAAANALLAGGLFRDAAVLFRDKLRNDPAAAAAFEQAGDYDEAVRLHDRTGRFEAADDLLRRLGDEGRAVAFFTRAADRLAARREWVTAGDLLRRKTGDLAAAGAYYRRGWDEDGADGVQCGRRLFDELLTAADWAAADRLLDAAEARFAPPRQTDAAQFFTYARAVAKDVLPPDRFADLSDRTRLLYARHVRAGGPDAAAQLFGRAGGWSAPVVRDASFAAGGTPRAAAHDRPARLVGGPVYAVVVARGSGDVVVAAAGGIAGWRRDGTVAVYAREMPARPLLGLAASADGVIVVTLGVEGEDPTARCYALGAMEPARRGLNDFLLTDGGPPAGWYLAPVAGADRGTVGVIIATRSERLGLTGSYLAATTQHGFLPEGGLTHLLVRDAHGRGWDWADRFLRQLDPGHPPRWVGRWAPHWTPAVPPGSSLTVPRTDWITPEPGVIEVAGVDRVGVAHWFRFDGRAASNTAPRGAATTADRFTAACLVGPGRVVAATDGNEVRWLEPTGTELRPRAVVLLSVPARVVALATGGVTGEVVVVLADGSVLRVSPGVPAATTPVAANSL
jgi:tetratricopeptide (TPR) repeat protein